MSRKFMLSLMIFTVILALTGCGLQAQKKEVKESPAVDPKPSQETAAFTVFFGDDQAMYLLGEEREVSKNGKSVAELMINELIAGPKTSGLTITVPEETKLLSLEINDGVAYANFSREIVTKHPGGSAGETMTIYSIVNTLTQLPEIEEVQFLIEGEKQEAIWGHFYTLEPFKADEKLFAPKQ